jgi:hypothetical protein
LKHIARRSLEYQVKFSSARSPERVNELYDVMPEFLLNQIILARHSDTVFRHPLFMHWEGELIGSFTILIRMLRPLAVMKDDEVCRAAERSSTMYWVEKGDLRATAMIGAKTIEAFSEACKVTFGAEQFMFGSGEYFAEEVLFTPRRCRFYVTRTVLALTYAQLLAFTRDNFIKLKEECPLLAGCIEREFNPAVSGIAKQPGESWVRYVAEDANEGCKPATVAKARWALASPKNAAGLYGSEVPPVKSVVGGLGGATIAGGKKHLGQKKGLINRAGETGV